MKNELFTQLLESIAEAGEIRKGLRKPSRQFSYPPARIRTLRARWNLSQSQFASMIGVSKGTLENWEQGRLQGPSTRLGETMSKPTRSAC
jgi:putative transcriptional regulator